MSILSLFSSPPASGEALVLSPSDKKVVLISKSKQKYCWNLYQIKNPTIGTTTNV
jgi:hypothetical protein